MSNQKYSKESKLDAISLVTEQNYSQAEVARSLGLDPKLISRWIKESTQGEGQAFRGNGKLTAEQLEIKLMWNCQMVHIMVLPYKQEYLKINL